MKLSREKVLHMSHLILAHLDRDDGVEYFDEPQEKDAPPFFWKN